MRRLIWLLLFSTLWWGCDDTPSVNPDATVDADIQDGDIMDADEDADKVEDVMALHGCARLHTLALTDRGSDGGRRQSLTRQRFSLTVRFFPEIVFAGEQFVHGFSYTIKYFFLAPTVVFHLITMFESYKVDTRRDTAKK